MASVRHSMVQTIIEQMQQVTAEFKDVRERMRSAQAVLTRVRIVAPVRGIVVRLRYHTAGGVIEAGKSIMELLPVQEELIIEARVKPKDIDNVKLGQVATVRLTAANRRITPTINGEVIYISADSLQNENNGAPNEVDSYLARIRLNASEVKQLVDFSITSGMPVEVYIKTAERTFMEYLTKPIVDSMNRAFREL
jgi:HlyD family secretion protein